jgi:uncharacterized membrane protein YgcG
VTRVSGWLLAALLALPLVAQAQRADVPYLTGRVVDNAEVMKAGTRRRLAEQLQAHEQKTTNQVAVLTVPTIHGESVEEYAVRVFEQWKLGGKGKDNGVLVVVVPQDRRMRIEVGYGLEGTFTDAAASRIVRDVMTPRFRQGDYDGGISQGVGAILAQLEGKTAAGGAEGAPPAQARQSEFFKAPPMALHEKVLMGAFIFGIIGLFTFLGIVTPGMGWFLFLPDPVLGDVSGHDLRQRHHVLHPDRLSHRLSGRQAARVALGDVPESDGGSQEEGPRDDRRVHGRRQRWRLEFQRRLLELGGRRILRRRRQFRGRRRFRQLVRARRLLTA